MAALSVVGDLFRDRTPQAQAFFDRYPRFYESSGTGTTRNRLNSRHKALICNNASLLKGKRILDIGSHDGRWSFAALQSGATHVTGIEGRPHLVRKSVANMQAYGVSRGCFVFQCGDMFDELQRIRSGEIDVVLCFGLIYHTVDHFRLFLQIRQINPQIVIVDTCICSSQEPVIELRTESTAIDGNALAHDASNGRTVVGYPSRSALEMMLEEGHFSWSYIDWHALDIDDWTNIEEYRDGDRVSLVARNEPTGRFS